MTTALYEPDLGYYARGARQIGRGGDFFTSVSVGPLFGCLLARRFLREWRDAGNPGRWRIIECGAHDGTLAADILATLAELSPAAAAALEYVICEPLAALQAAQRTTLTNYGASVRFLEDPAPLAQDPLPGIAFGNELLDALPFHLIEWRGGKWLEASVTTTGPDESFSWHFQQIDDPLLTAALARLGSQFPDGYRTEIRTCYSSFLAPLVRALESGLMIWPDYGFARTEYYSPDRRSGTLRTFANHRAGENPLLAPGLADITAHVDFTAVAETAASLGGKVIDFQNQGAWLTAIARDWLLDQEGAPQAAALRQFQMLTHPAHLGGRFHIIELSWNPTATPRDPAALKHRLFGT